MPPSPSDLETLTLLDRYLDAAPRTGAATEDIGPFTLFISTGIWPYYAIPLVLFALIGGVWADRLERHRVMVASDVVRAVLHGLLAVLIFIGPAPIWAI